MFKFESKFDSEPLPDQCRSSGNHSRRLFQKTAALRHSLGGSDGRAQIQGVFESAAVAAGRTGSLEENVLPLLLY